MRARASVLGSGCGALWSPSRRVVLRSACGMPRRACDGFLCHVTVRCEHALWSGIRVKASGVFSEGLTKGRARCRSGCGLLWGLGPNSKHAHIDRYTQTNTGTQQHKQTHTGTQAHTETHRETQRHTERHRDTHRHIQAHKQTCTDTQRHTHRHLHTHTHNTHTDARRRPDRHRHTRTHTQAHRHSETGRRQIQPCSPMAGPLPLLCCRWGWLQLPVWGLLHGTPPRQALPPLPSGSMSLWLLCDKLGKGSPCQARPAQGPVPSAVGQNPIRVPESATSTQGTPRKAGAAATPSVSPHKGLPWWPGG